MKNGFKVMGQFLLLIILCGVLFFELIMLLMFISGKLIIGSLVFLLLMILTLGITFKLLTDTL